MAVKSKSVQFFVRVPPELLGMYKERCRARGLNHPEVTRTLIREFAAGRLNIAVVSGTPNLEDALS